MAAVYIFLSDYLRNVIKAALIFLNMSHRLLAVCSAILVIALAYFGTLFPNFYVIFGISMTIVALWAFYWADHRFNLNYKYWHYIIMILLFSSGMALNPLFFVFPVYDKVLHFIDSVFWCILIFVPVNRILFASTYKPRAVLFMKILFTISLFLSFMMLHEIIEYSGDKLYDLRLQGVYVSSSADLGKVGMREVQTPWDDTMQDEMLDIVGAISFGAAYYYLLRKRAHV
jgi:hypothetical protein